MSTENLSINKQKLVAKLKSKKYRDEYKLFMIEGVKSFEELMNSNYETEFIIISEFLNEKEKTQKLIFNKGLSVYQADDRIIKKISDTQSPQGIICIVKMKQKKVDTDSCFIFLESISDPGNLGTIIRTCDWFGFSNILLSNDSVDCYNTKVVRSTMGSLFHTNILYIDEFSNIKNNLFPEHTLYAADINGKENIEDISPVEKYGLIFGNESKGISTKILDLADITYKIKGSGRAESLNLAVSVGISLNHFKQ